MLLDLLCRSAEANEYCFHGVHFVNVVIVHLAIPTLWQQRLPKYGPLGLSRGKFTGDNVSPKWYRKAFRALSFSINNVSYIRAYRRE